jgi:hypothetical protein
MTFHRKAASSLLQRCSAGFPIDPWGLSAPAADFPTGPEGGADPPRGLMVSASALAARTDPTEVSQGWSQPERLSQKPLRAV